MFRLISLIIDGIRSLELKIGDTSYVNKYSLKDSPRLRKHFLDYLFYFLLLSYAPSKTAVTYAEASVPSSPAVAAAAAVVATTDEIPACMSESIYKRLKANTNLENGEEIEQVE